MSENKEKISISMDADLLRRIDALCEARNEARSRFIERIVENEIKAEESFVSSMESPIWRGLITALANSPKVVKTISTVLGEHMTDEEIAHMQKRVPELTEGGRQRQAEKRSSKKSDLQGS